MKAEGMESNLNFWEKPAIPPTGEIKVNWDIRAVDWLAYMLAKILPKTAGAMQPIHEYGSGEYFTKNIDPFQQESVRNYTFNVTPNERSTVWLDSDRIIFNNHWQVWTYG